jgi:hypothetical protein
MTLPLHKVLPAVAAFVLLPALTLSTSQAATLPAAPSNDTVAGATVIGALPTTISQDTTQATTDSVDASLTDRCHTPSTRASVWFKYTDTTGTRFIATMINSDYTGGFFVTKGDPALGDIVACGPSTVGVRATPGATYYVAAFSDSSVNGGRLELTFDKAPPAPEIMVTTNPRGITHRDGSAQLSGTYACTDANDSDSDIEGTLTQGAGGVKTAGDFLVHPLECDGAAHPWSARAASGNGPFRGGKASSVAFAHACGVFDCSVGSAEQTVRLSSRAR